MGMTKLRGQSETGLERGNTTTAERYGCVALGITASIFL